MTDYYPQEVIDEMEALPSTLDFEVVYLNEDPLVDYANKFEDVLWWNMLQVACLFKNSNMNDFITLEDLPVGPQPGGAKDKNESMDLLFCGCGDANPETDVIFSKNNSVPFLHINDTEVLFSDLSNVMMRNCLETLESIHADLLGPWNVVHIHTGENN